MKDLKNDISYVNEETQRAISNEVKLFKLQLLEDSSHYFAYFLSRMLLLVFGLIAFVFSLAALGFWLNSFLESTWQSFAIIGSGLFVLTLSLLALNKLILAGPIQDAFIKEIAPKLFRS